jgi:hypothetical protein
MQMPIIAFSEPTIDLQKVKDSWRVVNHRDIIPTVPRLMGYCHVEAPVYLKSGDLKHALVIVFLTCPISNHFYSNTVFI